MAELFTSTNSLLLTSPTSPSSQVEPAPSSAELTTVALLGLCCVLGIPGNVAVLILLLRKLGQNNFTHVLMLNLACCDLLCLTTLPVWIVYNLRQWDLNYGGLCKFISFLVYCSLYANIFTVTLMSIQRFMNVLHRHRWSKIGKKGEKALLLGLWGVSCFMTWPSVASTGRMEHGRFVCRRPTHLEGLILAARVFELLLVFILPFFVMTTFYICLYQKVKETAQSSNKRTSQLISRIIITFIVLWVPTHIVGIVGIVGALLRTSQPVVADNLEHFTDQVKMIHVFPLFSAVIDPFLYAFSFQKMWPINKERENEDVALQANNV